MRSIRSLLVLSFLASLFSPVFAQNTDEPKQERVTVITSDSLVFDYDKRIVVFTGNVVVVDPDMRLTSDVLTVTLDEEDEVEKIHAKKNVVIQMAQMNSRSGDAIYDMKAGKIVLTDKPQVSQGRSILRAETITYWNVVNRVEAKPRAQLIIFRGEGDEAKNPLKIK